MFFEVPAAGDEEKEWAVGRRRKWIKTKFVRKIFTGAYPSLIRFGCLACITINARTTTR